MKKIGRMLKFRVQNRVMVTANIVGNVPVEYVGEDEGRRTIPCICNQYLDQKCGSAGDPLPMITVSTHFGNERAMDCWSSVP